MVTIASTNLVPSTGFAVHVAQYGYIGGSAAQRASYGEHTKP
jgi:hypothetical protein